jgi:hypothetical protein
MLLGVFVDGDTNVLSPQEAARSGERSTSDIAADRLFENATSRKWTVIISQ